jgi:hypothetical protein
MLITSHASMRALMGAMPDLVISASERKNFRPQEICIHKSLSLTLRGHDSKRTMTHCLGMHAHAVSFARLFFYQHSCQISVLGGE